jgi:hypothetical protein
MKFPIEYLQNNKVKNALLVFFMIMLMINYIYGYRYSIPLIDNFVYKNTYYLLVILWVLVIWFWHLKIQQLTRLGFSLFLFSCFYQLLDKRIVAEILMSYCLLVFLTATILILVENIRNEKN